MSINKTVMILLISALGCRAASAAVVWADEFNGDKIDPGTWVHDVGGGGFGNGQLEYDTARRENSYIQNGNLVIEARRENYFGKSFTSARMLTQGRFAFKYGTLEARIKVPNTANGLWPAFWMMGNNFGGIVWPRCGEVDILELGSKAGIAEGLQQRKMNCALHFSDADGKRGLLDAWTNAPVDLSADYHLYKTSWTPTNITFYLDGAPFGSWDISADYFSELHQPMFPILNLAIGGWDPSYTGVYSPAAVTAPLPARMYVDWIRLYDNPHTKLYFGDDCAETGNFGVFTEKTPVNRALLYQNGSELGFDYESNAARYVWNNMVVAPPPAASEGTNCWSFNIAGGTWFGMGVMLPNFRNMRNYSDGYLHFDIKTAGTSPMKVGIKSSRGGEFWLPLGVDQTSEFGFARDGQWHALKIPLARFANIDFRTVHQVFMIAGDPASALNLSLDNIWWEPSVARPTPENGAFGVFTETAAHKSAGEFTSNVRSNFFIWEKTLVTGQPSPFEGGKSLSLQSAPGLNWFGAAFTPNVKYNLTAFRDPACKLRFCMRTSSSATFMIGMKSGNIDGVGQKWITFQAGSDPYGFLRDGAWHTVEIPMSEIATEVNLFEVCQLFQVLGLSGAISKIEFDDIHLTGGGKALTPAAAGTSRGRSGKVKQ
jgi:beta-glucanase (GH16 family)